MIDDKSTIVIDVEIRQLLSNMYEGCDWDAILLSLLSDKYALERVSALVNSGFIYTGTEALQGLDDIRKIIKSK